MNSATELYVVYAGERKDRSEEVCIYSEPGGR